MRIINFKVSNRSIDIDDEIKFSKLYPDELSELLYYDSNYIKWMKKEDLKKLKSFDIYTIICFNQDLIKYLIPVLRKLTKQHRIKLKNDKKIKEETIRYLE